MTTYATTFRHMIIDQVAGNMAVESRAGCPQGLADRPFERITAELMGARWDALAAGPGTVGQIIARICGTEKVCPSLPRYDVPRSARVSFRSRTRRSR